MIHFYIGDDDEAWKEDCEEMEGERPELRRLGEEIDMMWPSLSTVELM